MEREGVESHGGAKGQVLEQVQLQGLPTDHLKVENLLEELAEHPATPGICSFAVWQIPEPQLWCSKWQDLQTAAAAHTRERAISHTIKPCSRFGDLHQCFPTPIT